MRMAVRYSARRMQMRRLAAGAATGLMVLGHPTVSPALSELKTLPGQTIEQPAAPAAPSGDNTITEDPGNLTGIPDPDPLINKPAEPEQSATEGPDGTETPAAPVTVLYDINAAPEPVRRLRALIVEAAATGNIEKLRPLMNPGPDQTQVTIGTADPDPIATLKGLSGDPEGMEVLAILLDVLSAGFVRVDAGTPDEMYVWPYFAEKPLATLSDPEKVELLRIITAGDFATMLEYGNYSFFRVGISPDGQWKFFSAGE